MLAIRLDLVILDDHETGNQKQDADIVERRMCVCASNLLFLRRGRLEDEDSLGYEK